MTGTLEALGTITGSLAAIATLTGALSPPDVELIGALTIPERADVPVYSGIYTFTPDGQTQVVLTGGYYLEQDITINPVPQNYGLITWNGSTLTVS